MARADSFNTVCKPYWAIALLAAEVPVVRTAGVEPARAYAQRIFLPATAFAASVSRAIGAATLFVVWTAGIRQDACPYYPVWMRQA